jgi:hypothetical protein
LVSIFALEEIEKLLTSFILTLTTLLLRKYTSSTKDAIEETEKDTMKWRYHFGDGDLEVQRLRHTDSDLLVKMCKDQDVLIRMY